jgi:hypothetical protein
MNLPSKPSEHLAAQLLEQGERPEIMDELVRVLRILDDWHAPSPTLSDSARLVNRLMALSPSDPGVRTGAARPWSELKLLLRVIRAQMSLLRPAFWMVSLVIVLLGCAFVLSETRISHALALQIMGPLLCYLGAATVFRGLGLHTVELELACPPSARQLIVARLALVLSYDLVLGLLASLLLSTGDPEGLLSLTLHWVTPLLLIFGVTLLLSLRLPVHQAAGVTYAGWLAFLLLSLASAGSIQEAEEVLGLVGAALLLVAVGLTPLDARRHFPRG